MQEIKRLSEIFKNELHGELLDEAIKLIDRLEEQLKQNEINLLTLKGILANQKQEIKGIFESIKEANKTKAA